MNTNDYLTSTQVKALLGDHWDSFRRCMWGIPVGGNEQNEPLYSIRDVRRYLERIRLNG
jgi:hypothetical protein